MILASPGTTIHLSWQATDGDATLTVTGKIYKNDDTQLGSNISLTHVASGLYTATTTINDEGVYTILYTTNSAVHETTSETISIQYGWRPSMGSAEATIPKTLLDPLLKEIKDLKDGQGKLEQELGKKSEFNPNRDVVKTDVRPTSLRPLGDKMDKFKNEIKSEVRKPAQQKDLTKDFERIERNIREMKMGKDQKMTSFLNQISVLVGSLKTQQTPNKIEQMLEVFNQEEGKRHNELKELFHQFQVSIQPFLKINNILDRFKKNEED